MHITGITLVGAKGWATVFVGASTTLPLVYAYPGECTVVWCIAPNPQHGRGTLRQISRVRLPNSTTLVIG